MATDKGERRKAALVDAASHILVSDGVHAVTHRAVAGRAAVPLGATTYYFAGLDDLRQAAAEALADADVARMDSVVDAMSSGSSGPSGPHTLRTLAEFIVDLLTPEDDEARLAWYERYTSGARQPALATAARRTNAAARRHVQTLVTFCGLADAVPATVVLAVVDGAVLGALATGETDERAAATDALETVLAAFVPEHP